ncbi:MAG: 4Fe-4S binding protein [Armatimonadetes bacterium]|nr:4Fe-4S binding protein [Armatimonadota bacterium]
MRPTRALTMQPVQPITLWRRLTQVAALIVTGEWLAVGWLRCPFAVPFVSCASCPLSDCPGRYLQFPVIIGILLSSLVGGRLFCGWGCPMGFVEDSLGRLPRLKAFTSRAFARVDPWLKLLKYPALVLVVYLVFAWHEVGARPYPYVVRTASVFNFEGVDTAVALGATHYRVRLWILGAVLLLSVLSTRFWCRYLCPLGAILSLFNKVSVFVIRRRREDLPHCGKYPTECSQHTTPGTLDCIMCGECVQGCPRRVLEWGARLKRPVPAPTGADDQGIETA